MEFERVLLKNWVVFGRKWTTCGIDTKKEVERDVLVVGVHIRRFILKHLREWVIRIRIG